MSLHTDETANVSRKRKQSSLHGISSAEEIQALEVIKIERPQDSLIVQPNDTESCQKEGCLLLAGWKTRSNQLEWYPGMIITGKSVHLRPPCTNKQWILWLAEDKVSEVPVSHLSSFWSENGPDGLSCASCSSTARITELTRCGLQRLIEELEARGIRNLPKPDSQCASLYDWLHAVSQLRNFSKIREATNSDKIMSTKSHDCLSNLYDKHKSSFVDMMSEEVELIRISKKPKVRITSFEKKRKSASCDFPNEFLPREVTEEARKQFEEERSSFSCDFNICCICFKSKSAEENDSEEENKTRKFLYTRKKDIEEKVDIVKHPVFMNLVVCEACKRDFLSLSFATQVDGSHVLCAVCSRRGEFICCSNHYCQRVFCKVCVDLFVGDGRFLEAKNQVEWLCYYCVSSDEGNTEELGLLSVNPDWYNNVLNEVQPKNLPSTLSCLDNVLSPLEHRSPMTVLSVFHHKFASHLALSKLLLDVRKHYLTTDGENSSSKSRCELLFEKLDSPELLSAKRIRDLPDIDLVLGRYPSDEMTLEVDLNILENQVEQLDRKILEKFLQFFRILSELQMKCAALKKPLFWLYESPVFISRLLREKISLYLEREPVVFMNNMVASQHRARYYWGNLPDMYSQFMENSLPDCGIRKLRTVDENHELSMFWDKMRTLDEDNKLTVCEMEHVMGVPNYPGRMTESKEKRLEMLRQAGCIPMACHLLRPLTKIFATVAEENESDAAEPRTDE